jgi:two-component system chemotaxis response regulator CheB
VAIVQDPDEALYSGMPSSAIENVAVDRILRVSEIASALVELANQPVEQEGVEVVSDDMDMESDMAELALGAMQNLDRPGTPSAFGCPECGGVLWELDEDKLTRFRCRTGHAYSAHSLLAKQSDGLEDALWNALRALEEKAALAKRMANRARDRNQPYSTKRFTEQADGSQQHATLIREILLRGDSKIGLSTLNGELIKTKNLLDDRQTEVADGSVAVQEAGNGKKREQKSEFENGNSKLSARPDPFSVVALCASAGGLDAISQILSHLPADFGAAITVVQHLNPHYPSMMVEILARRTALSVKQAEERDVLSPGTVYVAPPDLHLLVNSDNTLSLSRSSLVHFVRPSADLLLESVAASFKDRAIAVILTGTGSDGAMGVRAIKRMGGTAIAQDRETAEFFGMPEAAIDTEMIDLILPLTEIAAQLLSLVAVQNKELPDS